LQLQYPVASLQARPATPKHGIAIEVSRLLQASMTG
jgi:hypothetical protein